MRLWLLHPELLHALSFRKEANGEYSIRSEVSGLWRKAVTEEIIRQLFIKKLVLHYRTPRDMIVEEYVIQMGIARKRADVAVVTAEGEPQILCEIKQELNDSSIEQLRSYMIASGTPYGVLASAGNYKCVSLTGRNFTIIDDLPQLHEFLKTAINQAGIRDNSPDVRDSASSNSYLDSVSPLQKNRFMVVLQGQEMALTEKQLFAFRAVRREALKMGVRMRYECSQEEWERHVCEKLKENQKNTATKAPIDRASPNKNRKRLATNVLIDHASPPHNFIEDFLKERTMKVDDVEITKGELFTAYKQFCRVRKTWPCGKIQFGRRLHELGYDDRRANDGIHVWRGLCLTVRPELVQTTKAQAEPALNGDS